MRAERLRGFARLTKDKDYREVLLKWADEFDRMSRQDDVSAGNSRVTRRDDGR